jgi:hypothetical protein
VSTTVQPELHEAAQATPVYTLFDSIAVDVLTAEHLAGLAAGITALVRVKQFFTVDECDTIMTGLATCEMGGYEVTPPIAKLGPAAYDFYKTGALGPEYFTKARFDTAQRRGLLDGRDPLDVAIDRLAKVWGDSVGPATAAGQEMYAGMIREINLGARMHFDELARECPTALDVPPVAQLAFNCHLIMPEAGGEAVVYRRRWLPADENHRDGYGYQPHLVENEPVARVRPEVGDAVLFDSRNYHLVTPAIGGRRVTLSFFIGVTGRGPLIVWS